MAIDLGVTEEDITIMGAKMDGRFSVGSMGMTSTSFTSSTPSSRRSNCTLHQSLQWSSLCWVWEPHAQAPPSFCQPGSMHSAKGFTMHNSALGAL